MIDIFTPKAPFEDLSGYVLQCFQEAGGFLIHTLILLFLFIWMRRLRPIYRIPAALTAVLILLSFLWIQGTRSDFFYSLSLAFLLTAQLPLLRLFSPKAENLLFFFSAMLFPARLFNSTSLLFGDLWLFWIIFAVCCITVRLEYCRLSGNQFGCYFLFVFLSLSAYLFRLAVSFLLPCVKARIGNYAVSLFLLSAFVLFLLIGAAWLTGRKFGCRLRRLNASGRKYPGIERYYFCFSLLILALCTLLFLPFTISDSQTVPVLLLFPALCLILLWMQFPFLWLLYQTAFYRDNAAFAREENATLISYYQEREKSLATMSELRHDMKNIFLTMGEFVNRSRDPEMKEFFWNKIYPYSTETIRKSELFSALCQIPSEPLRAFFYLKLSQASHCQVKLKPDIRIFPECFRIGMNIIDLTRILGILLDNAADETAMVSDGYMELKISNDETGCTYFIKNPVTDARRKSGIQDGVTSKGEGHGYGLCIIRRLLEQYPSASLNTVLQDGFCIQSLNIMYTES